MRNNRIIQEISVIKLRLLVFVFFLVLNFSTTGGHIFSIDDVQYFLHTENLALNHSIKIDPTSPSASQLAPTETYKQIQHKFYSYQGKDWSENTPLAPYYDASSILLPFVSVPLYYLAIITSSNPVNVLGFFTNSIILSINSLLIFITGNYLFKSQKISFVLSLIFLVTTFVWPYNTGMMLRPLAALVTILGFYLLITSRNMSDIRSFLGGLCIGLVLLAEAASLIILPGMFAFGIFYLHKNKKKLVLFIIGFLITITAQAVLNEIRFGTVTDFGFGFQQNITYHSGTDGMIGYIFSIGWGILFNSPILVLFPPAIYIMWKQNKPFALLLAYCFVITWIFFGTQPSPDWSGYGAWGPRYFIVILPLLILSIGFVMKEFSDKIVFKVSFVSLAIFGFFVNFMGKLVWYMYGYSYGWEILHTHLIKNGWLLENYDFHYAPITLHILALTSNYIKNMGIPQNMPQSWGLAPCTYDLYIFCKLGIIPFITILAGLAITAYFLLRILLETNKEESLTKEPFKK